MIKSNTLLHIRQSQILRIDAESCPPTLIHILSRLALLRLKRKSEVSSRRLVSIKSKCYSSPFLDGTETTCWKSLRRWIGGKETPKTVAKLVPPSSKASTTSFHQNDQPTNHFVFLSKMSTRSAALERCRLAVWKRESSNPEWSWPLLPEMSPLRYDIVAVATWYIGIVFSRLLSVSTRGCVPWSLGRLVPR